VTLKVAGTQCTHFHVIRLTLSTFHTDRYGYKSSLSFDQTAQGTRRTEWVSGDANTESS